jgi:xylobiose transport system substrate-binding protein
MVLLRKWMARGLVALSVAGVAAGVSACGGSSGSSASSNHGQFIVADYGDANDSLEQYAIKTYNATPEGHKVKAVLEAWPGANYQLKLQTVMSTSKAPDVFYNWGSGSIEQFVEAGLVRPLNSSFSSNPALKSNFLSATMNAAKIGNSYYGIPMRGAQPVFLYYNKSLLAKYHMAPPATWQQLLSDVSTLKNAGLIPIALGGGDQWPSQMWLEYVYDRVAGPSLVSKALTGDTNVWSSAASKEALGDVKQLIQSGAFGNSYDSVKFTDSASTKLMVTGKAAFELMGSWEYSTVQGINPSFAKNDLGYVSFPSIPGGAGNSADLVGNAQNYYSVLKSTKYSQAITDFMKVMYSDGFQQQLLSKGWLPTTTNATQFFSKSPTPAYMSWQYGKVKAAPAFQESWDQAWPVTDYTPIHTAVGTFFDNTNEQQFISSMSQLSTK